MRTWWNHLKSSWHRSLSLLWLMIIALQWLSYTEPIWFEQTTATVLIVLTAVAVIEILLPVNLLTRLLLEAVAIVYIVYRTLTHYGVYIPSPSLTLGDKVQDMAVQMLPYIGFALGAWVLLLLFAWWVSTKARILMFIGMNIAAFAALDSFTTTILWQEVAWTVFAGMGWLVTHHLRGFQLRFPRGWVYLLNYPFKVAVNIAIIFSLVILTGVNMPEVSPTLTDPYTAWRDWSGTGISSGIGSGGSSDTDNGKNSTRNTTTGYSLDDKNLGGGFNFDYSPVMTVTSDLRTYMRGETRRVYSGNGWKDDDRVKRGNYESVEVAESLEIDEAPKVQTQGLQQTVKMLGNNEYPVLFGTYSISRVDAIDGATDQADGISWRSRDSELLWDIDNQDVGYPQTYVLTAEIPVIPVQELSKKTYEDLYEENKVGEQFLQLPDKLPARVRELAEKVTAAGKTPYEKTGLLQQYLQQTFPYTNQPDVSQKVSSDFVDSFLFEVKEGYCDYYSTALVVMARSLDIPARWVKGYAPGEQAERMSQLGDGLSNIYTVTNADSHSWAEVYFGEYGWVPVEATPGFNVPLLTENETTPQTEPEEETESQPKPENKPGNETHNQNGFHLATWVVLAAAVILLSWLGYLVWHWRFSLRFLLQRLRQRRALSPDQKVMVETGRWIRYMRSKGLRREEHETLRESVGRWSHECPTAANHLSALLGMFEQAKYSPDVIEDKDWRSVYTEALRLRKSMKSRK